MKTPEQRQKAREIADRLQAEQLQQNGQFTDWFEELYAGANFDPGLIPWADEKPHPGLVEWMADQVGQGAQACDVGCGLGDNAAFLAANGYDVTAFDLSKSAVDWARQRFLDKNITFRVEDLFKLSADLPGQFDLVHETYTVQALPQQIRPQIYEAIASLVAPKGRLLLICRARPEDVPPQGPPWPLARSEVDQFLVHGLEQVRLEEFTEQKPDGRMIPHFRAEFIRPC